MACPENHDALRLDRTALVVKARFRGIQNDEHDEPLLELWNCRTCGTTIGIELVSLAATNAHRRCSNA